MTVLTGMAVIMGITSIVPQLAFLPETKICNKLLDNFSLSAWKYLQCWLHKTKDVEDIFYHGETSPIGLSGRIVSNLRHITIGRTPLHQWSSLHRDLYLTSHNRHTSLTPMGFEPEIQAGERSQTHTLDRATIGTGDW
jgi:hypothetical protein